MLSSPVRLATSDDLDGRRPRTLSPVVGLAARLATQAAARNGQPAVIQDLPSTRSAERGPVRTPSKGTSTSAATQGAVISDASSSPGSGPTIFESSTKPDALLWQFTSVLTFLASERTAIKAQDRERRRARKAAADARHAETIDKAIATAASIMDGVKSSTRRDRASTKGSPKDGRFELASSVQPLRGAAILSSFPSDAAPPSHSILSVPASTAPPAPTSASTPSALDPFFTPPSTAFSADLMAGSFSLNSLPLSPPPSPPLGLAPSPLESVVSKLVSAGLDFEYGDGLENGAHVFVDHSNILVGLLSLPPIAPSTGYVYKRNLSHEALVLALVRGRPLATKALVASSPLWQPLDDFNEDGWDCCVLRRVALESLYQGMGHRKTSSITSAVSSPTVSAAESFVLSSSEDEGSRRSRDGRGKSKSRGGLFASEGARGHPNHTKIAEKLRPDTRPMKEQAVDELLQLKIFQTLLTCPPSTLVLGTGDCAGSPLNAGGFRQAVELALSLGWTVELWAWKSGLSSGWKDVQAAFPRTFSVHLLDLVREELEGEGA